jgi:hypothetical protein
MRCKKIIEKSKFKNVKIEMIFFNWIKIKKKIKKKISVNKILSYGLIGHQNSN